MSVVSLSGKEFNAVEAAAKRERIKQMLESARSGKPKALTSKASRATSAIVSQLLGGKLRFVMGALLLVGCLMWANHNNLFDQARLSEVSKTVAASATSLIVRTISPN